MRKNLLLDISGRRRWAINGEVNPYGTVFLVSRVSEACGNCRIARTELKSGPIIAADRRATAFVAGCRKSYQSSERHLTVVEARFIHEVVIASSCSIAARWPI